MESKNDAELVHLARAGNRDAYDELIRRYQRSICGLAYVLVNDRFEAEDLAQEAFLRAWQNLDLLGDPAKFGPWLRRIIFGVSIDWLRAFRQHLYRLTDVSIDPASSGQSTHAESALERLQAIELRQRIWSAVGRLPERYRLPLTLFHLDGLSHGKVAEALGVPVSTVRSLVTRARQRLQPMLASYAAEVLPAMDDVFREQTIGHSAVLHITDGESVAGTLRESGIPGHVSVYGDLLFEGPAPAGLNANQWREVRARFMARPGGLRPNLEEARQYLLQGDNALAACSQHQEVLIWLDHALSRQLILIRLLDWFSRQDLVRIKVSLICIGSYAGMDRFAGLGQLDANQLSSLADTRQRVDDAQYRTARAAWDAFTSADPTPIERLIRADSSPLPFLAAALRRHLEQFPSVENGLSRTEQQALSVLFDHGPLSGPQLYVRVQRLEEQIFMGDLSFYRIMADLSHAPHPLVEISDAPPKSLGQVSLTSAGRSVMEARADHIALNGIDRWLGGVHLIGNQVAWRWDASAGQLVSSGQSGK